MAKHKHAALMQQYAKDWAETDEPWKRWEVASCRNEWVALCGHPCWKEESEYRRKPLTMTYTITIPKPLMEVPKDGEVYYVTASDAMVFCIDAAWYRCETDRQFLKRGLCFATKEDAIAAANAMMPSKGE